MYGPSLCLHLSKSPLTYKVASNVLCMIANGIALRWRVAAYIINPSTFASAYFQIIANVIRYKIIYFSHGGSLVLYLDTVIFLCSIHACTEPLCVTGVYMLCSCIAPKYLILPKYPTMVNFKNLSKIVNSKLLKSKNGTFVKSIEKKIQEKFETNQK